MTAASGAPHLTIVTLGVADLGTSRAFYERLGLVASRASTATVAFFEAGGTVLGLYGRAALAEDARVADRPTGFAAVTLAWNLASEAEVDEAMQRAVAAGARCMKTPETVFWGGYSGYFADPDGHLWEVAYNPFFLFDGQGRMTLPPPPAADEDNQGP